MYYRLIEKCILQGNLSWLDEAQGKVSPGNLPGVRIYFLSCDSQAGQVNQRSSIQMKTQKE